MDDIFELGERNSTNSGATEPSSPRDAEVMTTSMAEIQRLLAENKKLRTEKNDLRRQLGAALANQGTRTDSAVETTKSGDGNSVSEKRGTSGKPSAAQQEKVNKLQSQLEEMKKQHQHINQIFSAFTINTLERERGYESVYTTQMEELEKLRVEKEALQAELAKEREKNIRVQGESGDGYGTTQPGHPATTIDAGETVAQALGIVHKEMTETLRRVAAAVSHIDSGGDNRGRVALRNLNRLLDTPLKISGGRRGKRGATDAGEDVVEGSKNAEEGVEAHEVLDGQCAGVGEGMSARFREELQRHHTRVLSQPISIPKGAGALRANVDNSRKRKRAPQSTASQDGGTGSTSAASGVASPKARQRRRKDDGDDQRSEAAASVNPFEGVRMIQSAGSENRDKDLVAGRAEADLAGAAKFALPIPSNPLEAFLSSARRCPPSSASRQQVLQAYKNNYAHIADEIKHSLLKQCMAAYTMRSDDKKGTSLPALATSADVAVEMWLMDWDHFAAVELTIWSLLQGALRLEVDRLVPALQSTLIHSILSVMQRGATSTSVTSLTPASIAALQMHVLTTALNFLWLQYMQHLSRMTSGAESPDTHLKQSPSMRASIITARRQVIQLLYDASIVALQKWPAAGGQSCPVTASPLLESEPPPATSNASNAAEGDASRDGVVTTERTFILRLWMSMLRGLCGRSVARLHLLQHFQCSSELYDEVFVRQMVTFSVPGDLSGEAHAKVSLSLRRSHALVSYTIKAILGECWKNTFVINAAAPPSNTEMFPPRKAATEVWYAFTEAMGWSCAVVDVEAMAAKALHVAVAVTEQESKRRDRKEARTLQGSVEEQNKCEKDEEDDEEDEEPVFLTVSEQGRALAEWEANAGAALLSLRLIVLYRGFNFINEWIQPHVVGKPRGEDVMAHVLSSIVMDLKWVGGPALEAEGEEDKKMTTERAGDGERLAGSDEDVRRRVLHYLVEYVTSSRLPLPLVGSVRVLSIAGAVQLVSAGGPRVIRQHLMPIVKWLRTAVKKYAALRGLSVSEDPKKALPRLLPKESAWQSTTGLWVLETLA